jgi:hypothetical protein
MLLPKFFIENNFKEVLNMYCKEIMNPKTNRKVTLKTWMIEPRKVIELIKQKKIESAKDLSFMLLNDEDSLYTIEQQEGGDGAENNFGLAIFEYALDWRLGMTIINFIQGVIKKHKRAPKPFEIGVSRKGDIFLILPSGRIIAA